MLLWAKAWRDRCGPRLSAGALQNLSVPDAVEIRDPDAPGLRSDRDPQRGIQNPIRIDRKQQTSAIWMITTGEQMLCFHSSRLRLKRASPLPFKEHDSGSHRYIER